MLNSVLNRNIVLACLADCPADNHARQLAQFLCVPRSNDGKISLHAVFEMVDSSFTGRPTASAV
jgi:hypothetical protein